MKRRFFFREKRSICPFSAWFLDFFYDQLAQWPVEIYSAKRVAGAEGAIVDQAAKWTNFAFWDVAR